MPLHTMRCLAPLEALRVGRENTFLVESDGELVVVEIDGLDLAISFFTTAIQALMSRWTPGVVYTRQVWNACTAGTLLAFRTLHVKTNIATLTGSIGIRIQLPALFARALKITHAALEFLLATSIARTLHTGIGLVAVRIVAAFLADATYAVLRTAIALAMVVAMTIGIPRGTTIHSGE